MPAFSSPVCGQATDVAGLLTIKGGGHEPGKGCHSSREST